MAVIRVNKTRDYTIMSNTHFKEREMSLKAKGLLSLMLSLPDDWDYSISGLVTLSKDGKDSVMNALTELEAFGYLVRTQTVDEKGRFAGYEYNIYEKAITDKPNSEKPNTDKPIQLNTNKSNTNELNNNNNIYSQVIDYLNEKAQKTYRANSKQTQSHIRARVNEGFTLDDFKAVIDNKCKDWMGTDFEQYLRPSTLFGTKFESYLNAPSRKKGATSNGTEDYDSDFERC